MPNIDEKTGIFYGVISQRSLFDEALDIIFFGSDSVDLYYEEWREDIATAIKNALADLVYDSDIEDIVAYAQDNARYDSDEINPEYNDVEYHIIKCLDSDLMILKSPYVTWAPPCSPCVPEAGNLDDAAKQYASWGHAEAPNSTAFAAGNSQGGARLCYALGPDWFDNDIAPYPYATLHADGTLSAWTFPDTTPHNHNNNEE
jgi:hypothetical protein